MPVVGVPPVRTLRLASPCSRRGSVAPEVDHVRSASPRSPAGALPALIVRVVLVVGLDLVRLQHGLRPRGLRGRLRGRLAFGGEPLDFVEIGELLAAQRDFGVEL